MFVVGRQAEQVFAGFDAVARFQIVVNRTTQRDEMTFKIELKDETVDKEQLAEELNQKFQSVCLLKVDKIEFVPKGTIPEPHKTIVDERVWA
jgi:phenylacetate-coenzyme A ligase PaaK-like adenylate-forming protein